MFCKLLGGTHQPADKILKWAINAYRVNGMSADHTNQIDNTSALFPFAAVVNQEKAKEALLLAVINPAVHGVLFLGEKGKPGNEKYR